MRCRAMDDPRWHDPRAADPERAESRDADPRDASPRDPRDVFTRDLDLPRGPARERVVASRPRRTTCAGPRSRTLATVGAFRVVPADDLRDDDGPARQAAHGDLGTSVSSGLIRHVAAVDREGRARPLSR